jgi:cell division protein FtsB
MRKIFRSKIFLFSVVAAVIAVGMGVGRLILENRELDAEIAKLETESEDFQTKNLELLELVRRFQTDSFLEREARLKLNLQKPGEQVIGFKRAGDESASGTAYLAEEIRRSNVSKWRDYFFAPERMRQDKL